jgi:hypothetical protein
MPYIGKSPSFGVRNRFVYVADASDTSVSGADANGATLTFTDGAYVDVYLNGVLLKPTTDYNTNTANTIAGISSMSANDEVTVVVYDVFAVADTVSATSGGTFSGGVTFGGVVDITDTTDSSDATGDTGALRTEGGASIAKKLYVGTDLDVDGTANLDAVDIDGAVDMASTLAVSGLTTVSNAIQFNEVAIPSAGEAAIYRRNTDDNLYIQAASVSGSNKGLYILDGGQNAIALFEASEIDLSIDVSLAGFALFDNAQNTKFYTTNSMATQKAASIPQSVNTQGGELLCAVDAGTCFFINRGRSDGTIADFRRGGTTQGSISISSTTTSYNAFTGSHWSRLTDNSKPTILRGTVMETIDEMCDWYALEFTIPEHTVVNAQGNSIVEVAQGMHISYEKPSNVNVGDTIKYTHEGVEYDATVALEGDIKHVKSKISDTADCTNVYGVFMDWDNDDDTVNDMYVNAVGTAVVRIHKDQTVAKGDLLSSNGDGTAKKQDDDIIRTKTIGKVLTNIKQETYSDGSYTVPCALYCG